MLIISHNFKSVNSNRFGTTLIAIYVSVNLAQLPLKIWAFPDLSRRKKENSPVLISLKYIQFQPNLRQGNFSLSMK